MYKIHVFGEAFFFLAIVTMITVNVNFFSFHSNYCKGNKYFHDIYAAYHPNHSWKNIVEQRKSTQKKISQKCFFYPITKDPNPNDGVRMQQKLLSWI